MEKEIHYTSNSNSGVLGDDQSTPVTNLIRRSSDDAYCEERPSSFNEISDNGSGSPKPTPNILRSKAAVAFNAMSPEERRVFLKEIKKDKICAISFGRRLFKLQGDGKYRYVSAEVMLSLDGEMHYLHYDKDTCPLDFDVILGNTYDGAPVAVMKVGKKNDSTGKDTRDVRRPEFFAARLVVKRSDGSKSVANYYYHDAARQLSSNISGEIPDASTSSLVFTLLANFINKSSMDL